MGKTILRKPYRPRSKRAARLKYLAVRIKAMHTLQTFAVSIEERIEYATLKEEAKRDLRIATGCPSRSDSEWLAIKRRKKREQRALRRRRYRDDSQWSPEEWATLLAQRDATTTTFEFNKIDLLASLSDPARLQAMAGIASLSTEAQDEYNRQRAATVNSITSGSGYAMAKEWWKRPLFHWTPLATKLTVAFSILLLLQWVLYVMA